jgi:predicted nuclease with RNAse H fold
LQHVSIRNEDIVSTITSRVSVVAIDAPIAREARMRELNREAIRRGYRVLPPSMQGMRMLTQRAWKISLELTNIGDGRLFRLSLLFVVLMFISLFSSLSL